MSSFILLGGTKRLLFDLNIKPQHELFYHTGHSVLLKVASETRHSILMFPSDPGSRTLPLATVDTSKIQL